MFRCVAKYISDVNVMKKNIGKSLFKGDFEKPREDCGAAREGQRRCEISPRARDIIEQIALLDEARLKRLIELIMEDSDL